jgi:hypothetical protein
VALEFVQSFFLFSTQAGEDAQRGLVEQDVSLPDSRLLQVWSRLAESLPQVLGGLDCLAEILALAEEVPGSLDRRAVVLLEDLEGFPVSVFRFLKAHRELVGRAFGLQTAEELGVEGLRRGVPPLELLLAAVPPLSPSGEPLLGVVSPREASEGRGRLELVGFLLGSLRGGARRMFWKVR